MVSNLGWVDYRILMFHFYFYPNRLGAELARYKSMMIEHLNKIKPNQS